MHPQQQVMRKRNGKFRSRGKPYAQAGRKKDNYRGPNGGVGWVVLYVHAGFVALVRNFVGSDALRVGRVVFDVSDRLGLVVLGVDGLIRG